MLFPAIAPSFLCQFLNFSSLWMWNELHYSSAYYNLICHRGCIVCYDAMLNRILVVITESKWKCMLPQKCNLCFKTFSNAGNLRQHIMNVHTPGDPVTCDDCSKEFKNKEYLRKHQVIIHKVPLRKQKSCRVSPGMIQWKNMWPPQTSNDGHPRFNWLINHTLASWLYKL